MQNIPSLVRTHARPKTNFKRLFWAIYFLAQSSHERCDARRVLALDAVCLSICAAADYGFQGAAVLCLTAKAKAATTVSCPITAAP